MLAVKQQQIDSLLEITRAVNNNMPITALSRIYENILHAQLGVTKIALFIKEVDDKWMCITPGELEGNILNYDVQLKLALFSFTTPVAAIKDDTLKDFEFLIPVMHKKEPIGFALIGAFGNDSSDTKEEKLKFIQTITNVIVVANENKKLFKSQIDQLVMQKELNLFTFGPAVPPGFLALSWVVPSPVPDGFAVRPWGELTDAERAGVSAH